LCRLTSIILKIDAPFPAAEAVQDGRIHIELINEPFMEADGTPAEYRAGLDRAITKGWLWRHESGVYVKLTPVGADLFA
jgi:hypothetical protein